MSSQSVLLIELAFQLGLSRSSRVIRLSWKLCLRIHGGRLLGPGVWSSCDMVFLGCVIRMFRPGVTGAWRLKVIQWVEATRCVWV